MEIQVKVTSKTLEEQRAAIPSLEKRETYLLSKALKVELKQLIR